MNPPPDFVNHVSQRLDAVTATLERFAQDNSNALREYRESDERYRKELAAYSAERASSRLVFALSMTLRISAVLLLGYIAFRVS